MGTKNEPGKFDCYKKAEADEPLFTLLGRDPMAAALVRAWADWRAEEGEDPAVVREARVCALQMEKWAVGRLKKPKMDIVVAGYTKNTVPR